MVVRKWVNNPGPAWQYREVQLRRHGEIWLVRRIGQVWMPDEGHPDEETAMQTICGIIGPDWTEVPASRSPDVRYGH